MQNFLSTFLIFFSLGPIYGDCFKLLQRNNFSGNENPCSLLPDGGTGDGGFPKFYFNSSSRSCETFIYGGCDGNGNNFWTEEQCKEACYETDSDVQKSNSRSRVSLTSTSERRVCEYPKREGTCYDTIKRYYFNGESCEEFIFRGCGENPNNFETAEECMKKCGHKVDIGSEESEDYEVDF